MLANLRLEVDGHLLQKTDSKIIYLIYLFCGGIYFEKHLTSKGKLALLVINGVMLTLIGVGGGCYLFLNLNQDLPALFYCSQTINGSIVLCAHCILMFWVKKNLKEFVVVCDQNFHIRLRRVDGESVTSPSAFCHKKIQLEYTITVILSIYTIIIAVNIAARPTHLLLFAAKDYNNMLYHVFPIHTFSYTLEFYSYSVIVIVQAVLGFYFSFILDVYETLIIAIIASIFNSCIDLANTMHDESRDYLENWINNAMAYDSTEVKKYLQKLKGYSRDYMKIIEQLNELNTFINVSTSVAVVIAFLGTIPVGTCILLGAGSIPIGCIIGELTIMAMVVVILFTTCYSGALLEELNEIMMQDVYNIPWFALPPRERKLPLNLLVQLQQRYTLSAIRIIPVTMNLFPRIMHINYSIINVLRVKHKE